MKKETLELVVLDDVGRVGHGVRPGEACPIMPVGAARRCDDMGTR
jgi:hypothetical protein